MARTHLPQVQRSGCSIRDIRAGLESRVSVVLDQQVERDCPAHFRKACARRPRAVGRVGPVCTLTAGLRRSYWIALLWARAFVVSEQVRSDVEELGYEGGKLLTGEDGCQVGCSHTGYALVL